MKENNMQTLVRAILIIGIALWMSIIMINNISDPGTQIFLLSKMYSMELFKNDPMMGQGLLSRAIDWPPMAVITLLIVVIYEVTSVILLWRSAISYVFALKSNDKGAELNALKRANIALSSLLFLWLFFMCGGLFFGYWLKMGSVQTVHVHLLIVTLIAFIFMNYDSYSLNKSV